jgi:hypothetical protein
MDPVTLETLNRDPELLHALMRQARRERAEAIHRIAVRPVKRLLRMEACSETDSSRASAFSSRAGAPA